MRTRLAWALVGNTLLCLPLLAGEPIVTDSRLITEERRVQILEAKLASMQRQIELIEDHKAIERLQQLWGHYVSEGMAREAANLFSASPAASIEYAQQGVYLGRPRIEAFLKERSPPRLLPSNAGKSWFGDDRGSGFDETYPPRG